jgi:hypothetical protein
MNETPTSRAEVGNMECEEKGRLLKTYQAAVSEWTRVTEQLNAWPYTLLERARELREAAVKAKIAYSDHKSEHGC